jgi:hypothetical protein
LILAYIHVKLFISISERANHKRGVDVGREVKGNRLRRDADFDAKVSAIKRKKIGRQYSILKLQADTPILRDSYQKERKEKADNQYCSHPALLLNDLTTANLT